MKLPQIPARRAALLVASAALTVPLAACVENAPGDAESLQVTSTETECKVSTDSAVRPPHLRHHQ